jgi:putative transposase
MSKLPEIKNAKRQAYPSDLSDQEWEIIEELLPEPKGFGRPRTVDLREIVNAIFYVQRSGCQWEMLPHDFPHYGTVYKYFAKWQKRGVWLKLHEVLRHKLRQKLQREEKSSVAIVDSQSVKTTEKRGMYMDMMEGRKLREESVI